MTAAPIDWSRLAEPQRDQYDTEITLQLASTSRSAGRSQLYQRTPVGASPSAFDGQVAIRHVYRNLPEFSTLAAHFPDAPADHPNIALAAEHIRTWPAAFAQCQRLLEAIHPGLDPRQPTTSTAIYRGSTSHSYERLFGTLWSTVGCPIGLAQSIVHEMAHQKLRALGVSFESASTIVDNDPSARFVSPIIKDRLRPMTAVLHALYSFVHVTALLNHMLEPERDSVRRASLRWCLAKNLARIEEGHATVSGSFEPGKHGVEFMKGFAAWTEKTIGAAKKLLDRDDANPRHVNGASGKAAAVVSTALLPCIPSGANRIRTPDREIDILLTVSSPRIVVLANVLSDEECEGLIALSEPRLERSAVVGDAEGNSEIHPSRTSRGMGLRRGETDMVARIEARLAALTQWPVERAEGLQILRYEAGGEYRPHHDWFPDLPGLRRLVEVGGQRLATFVLYLSEVEAGGTTSFPSIGLEVMPQKGGAVFFLNTNADLVPDPLTLHAGRPVIRGVKFIANKWLRQTEL